jgi:outer membrane immunogenic protein
MKRLPLALIAVTALSGSALAADLPARIYTKAQPQVAVAPSWTGFYVFGGGGGGMWNADSNEAINNSSSNTRDQRLGGHGAFGTVGAGYDWQFARSWVAGAFADGMFGSLSGSLSDPLQTEATGTEKLRTTWAVGARLGYLVAPNVLSYVNAGYTGSAWSGTTMFSATVVDASIPIDTTPSFHRDGWFVGGGVENSLNIFGVTAPGWFMKTEYRAAYFGRVTLPETAVNGNPVADILTFKPWSQTVSTSLVYRFNSGGPTVLAADQPAYAKAASPIVTPSWTGFYLFGGGGGGIWDADSNLVGLGIGNETNNQRLGGDGWFATAGAGYDWQFAGSLVAGVFADGMFGAIKGSLSDPFDHSEGTEKLRTTWAAGARFGYLVAPNVLSYVNAGYTSSEWSGVSFSRLVDGGSTGGATPSFHRDGWFVGGGVESSLNIFGISAPGWTMKTEYRAAYFDRISLPETNPQRSIVTFQPTVQTVSTSLVYRFNSDGRAASKY